MRREISAYSEKSCRGPALWRRGWGSLMSGPTPSDRCQSERVPSLTSLEVRTGRAGYDQHTLIAAPALLSGVALGQERHLPL